MKKFNMGYLGLIGIPLAVLGVVGSVALAAPQTPIADPAAVPARVHVAQSADTDTETNDDATSTVTDEKNKPEVAEDAETNDADESTVADSKDKPDTEVPGTSETNDDAGGPHEAVGTETAE